MDHKTEDRQKMERLEAKNIALDTQFIIKHNFLDGELVKEFARHADAGRVNLFLTIITYREILKHFRMHLVLAKSRNIDKQAQKLYVLKHFDAYKPYFTLPEINIDSCHAEFKQQFDSWIKTHKVTVLEPFMLAADRVLDDYFEMRPPFEESKKDEFPDAFSLEILSKHFTNRNRKCYLISDDSGLSRYESEIIFTKQSAGEVLQLIVKEADENSPVSFIENQFWKKEGNVVSDVSVLLKDHIKNAILSTYIINGRLIHGIERLEVNVANISDLYVLSVEGSTFSLVFTSLVIVDSEVSLLSTEFSSQLDETYTIRPKEKPTIEIMKPILIDIAIKGEFDQEKAEVSFDHYSLSPVEGLFEES